MSRSPLNRRTAVLAVLAPIVTSGLIASAGSATAIPFEGDPTPTTCLQLERLPYVAPPGSTLFVSHGYVLVLIHDGRWAPQPHPTAGPSDAYGSSHVAERQTC